MKYGSNVLFSTGQTHNRFCQFLKLFCHIIFLQTILLNGDGQNTAVHFCTDNAVHLIQGFRIYHAAVFYGDVKMISLKPFAGNVFRPADVG